MIDTKDLALTEKQLNKVMAAIDNCPGVDRTLAMEMVMAYARAHLVQLKRDEFVGCLPPNLDAFIATALKRKPSAEDEAFLNGQYQRDVDSLMQRVNTKRQEEQRLNNIVMGEQ